jgi:hypothetical protein
MNNANAPQSLSTNATLGFAPSEVPNQLAKITPRFTDRAFLVGMTGSGKTTLARKMLELRTFVVALDYKRTLKWPEYQLCQSLRELEKATFPRLVYRPNMVDFASEDNTEKLWEWLYKRGNTTIYVDETALSVDARSLPLYYRACLMQGREHNIEVWSATQRPLDIPSIVGSESEHVYAFRLRLPQDRKRVEELTGIQSNKIAALTKRQFMYAQQDGEVFGPLWLSFQP